jgi:predicted MFS family arabinose efflux permease
VAALAIGTFTVVTSEMLPVGLLTPMGDSLKVSEGMAGLTLTITGLVAAVSAPLLISLMGRFDRRPALCALMGVLMIGNLGAAWAPSFGAMVVARVLVGIGMGGVWAIAAGAYAGALLGRRVAFVAAAGLAFAVLIALAVLLPRLPAQQAVPLGGVMRLFGNSQVRTGLIVVGFVVTGHFAAYTYIRPVLEDVSGAGAEMIGALLLVYGVAGVAGNFISGAGAARSPRKTLLVISAVMTATVLLLPAMGGSLLVAGALMAVWGLTYGGVSVSTQTWLLASAPGAREGASSLFVAVFNGAIALGALLGGLVADGIGITAVMWLGGALAALVTTAAGRAPADGKL